MQKIPHIHIHIQLLTFCLFLLQQFQVKINFNLLLLEMKLFVTCDEIWRTTKLYPQTSADVVFATEDEIWGQKVSLLHAQKVLVCLLTPRVFVTGAHLQSNLTNGPGLKVSPKKGPSQKGWYTDRHTHTQTQSHRETLPLDDFGPL